MMAVMAERGTGAACTFRGERESCVDLCRLGPSPGSKEGDLLGTVFSLTRTFHGSAFQPGMTHHLPRVRGHAWHDPATSTGQGPCPV